MKVHKIDNLRSMDTESIKLFFILSDKGEFPYNKI